MCVAVFWTKKLTCLITRYMFFFLHFALSFVSKMSLLLSPISLPKPGVKCRVMRL